MTLARHIFAMAGSVFLFVAGCAAIASAWQWLPDILPRAWPLAAACYVLLIACTAGAGFTAKDYFNRIKEECE